MPPKSYQFIIVFALFMAASPSATAAKFDLLFGGFSFSAKTRSSSGSVNGLGAYKIGLYLPLFEQFEAGIGYTLILSDVISGDAAFGLDIEGAYFPLSSNSNLSLNSDRVSARIEALWKPFIMFGYHARQFQSVSTQYTGFSIGLGVERQIKAKFNIKGLLRYASLAGPNQGESTEITGLGGITFGF